MQGGSDGLPCFSMEGNPTSITEYWRERPVLAGRWTVKDVVQGRPLGHPSHAMFVHFPSALFPTALVFDVLSRIDPDLTLARAAFYNIAFGLTIAVLAATTGLVDYLPMIGGSRKKQIGTYHLIAQVSAVSLFGVSLLVRAIDYDATQTPWPALLLAGGGALVISAGNYFGGYLVYRQGMRVSIDT
jgi:uncharacterized membrane protein